MTKTSHKISAPQKQYNNQLHRMVAALALLALCYGCTKTIQVDLNTTNPQLVIEGVITNSKGPFRVQLSKTVNFSEPNKFPGVSGAKVSITDKTAGLTNHLKEKSSGVYLTSTIKGVPGHTYQLTVAYGGTNYSAVSTMPAPIALDSITFKRLNIFGDDNIFVSVNFQDPLNKENHYTFEEYINGKRYAKTTFAMDDRLSDGRYIQQQLFTDSSYIQHGDSVSVNMHVVDKGVFNYFNTLAAASSPEASTPANPVSNITGKKPVLGYFSAQTTSVQSGIFNR